MEITPQSIITFSALITALGGIITIIFKFSKWLERQKEQDKELQEIRKEQCVICYGLLACLDGLKQLGANGNVTKSHEKLDKYINEAAHREER